MEFIESNWFKLSWTRWYKVEYLVTVNKTIYYIRSFILRTIGPLDWYSFYLFMPSYLFLYSTLPYLTFCNYTFLSVKNMAKCCVPQFRMDWQYVHKYEHIKRWHGGQPDIVDSLCSVQTSGADFNKRVDVCIFWISCCVCCRTQCGGTSYGSTERSLSYDYLWCGVVRCDMMRCGSQQYHETDIKPIVAMSRLLIVFTIVTIVIQSDLFRQTSFRSNGATNKRCGMVWCSVLWRGELVVAMSD